MPVLPKRNHDMVTEDGVITHVSARTSLHIDTQVTFSCIPDSFLGHSIPKDLISFNLRSILAQLSLDAIVHEIKFNKVLYTAVAEISFIALGFPGTDLLNEIGIGTLVGKLFCADDRRLIRTIDNLNSIHTLSSRNETSSTFSHFSIRDGRALAYASLFPGIWVYEKNIPLPIKMIGHALKENLSYRPFLRLHQTHKKDLSRKVNLESMLLVKTLPICSNNFVRVAHDQLPKGIRHTAADVFHPNSSVVGDIYELYGTSSKEFYEIPLEFYKTEQTQSCIALKCASSLFLDDVDKATINTIFNSAPEDSSAALFISAKNFPHFLPENWYRYNSMTNDLHMDSIESNLSQNPCYALLKDIEKFPEEGALFLNYVPSPFLKSLLLSLCIRTHVKRIFFKIPDNYNYHFSHQEQLLFADLYSFGITVTEVDSTKNILRDYFPRKSGSAFFVPLEQKKNMKKSVIFGVYGSHYQQDFHDNDEKELFQLFDGILKLQQSLSHPLFNKDSSIAIMSGAGGGIMDSAQRLAGHYKFLSCANRVNFTNTFQLAEKNPELLAEHAQCTMTYPRAAYLQAEKDFLLDFPIFFRGGIGSDLEMAIEENAFALNLKPIVPIILFGGVAYWREKLSFRFQCNQQHSLIKESAWFSNSLFAVKNAVQAIQVYKDFFDGKLLIGPKEPPASDGFIIFSD